MRHVRKSPPLISIVMLAFALGLTGCGKPEPKSDPKPEPKAAEKTVFDDLVKTKERAKTETDKATELNRQKTEEAMKKIEETATP